MPVTEEQFSKIVGGHGFEAFDESALSSFNKSLHDIISKSISSVQMGGRVSMPGEYFGSSPNHYTATTDGSHPSMSSLTDVLARPALEQSFPHVGGSDTLLDSVFEKALKDFRQQQVGGGIKMRVKKAHKEQSKIIFRSVIDRLLQEVRKVAKKTKLLKGGQIDRALKKL